MNNKKQTKKALCMSVLSMVLCVAMLVGMTFAWFTDTASTGVNKIVSGKLDVELEVATAWDSDGNVTAWDKVDKDTKLTFKTADNRAADQILWEPGCTYELPELRVVNEGNLALKYKLAITGIQGDAELNEVIDWTVNLDGEAFAVGKEHSLAAKNGETVDADILTIKGHMQESAGNKYQGMSIDGIAITVYATQDTVENDSYGNEYDKNADGTPDNPDWSKDVTVTKKITPTEASVVKDNEANPTITVKIPENTTTATSVTLIKTETTAPKNITVETKESTISAEVKLVDQDGKKVTAASGKFFTLTMTLPKNADVTGFYHNADPLTKVARAEDVSKANDQYYYNAETGILTFTTDDFSPFTAVIMFNGGQGTEAAPYQIATGEQAYQMRNATGYFKLVNDVVITNEIYLSSKRVVMDLNGHSITLEYATGTTPNNGGVFNISGKKSSLTINDSSTAQSGKVIGSSQTFSNKVTSAVRVGNYGTLIINGGHFYGMSQGTSCIFTLTNRSSGSKATVTINGGTFEVASPNNGTYYVLNHQDGSTTDCTMTVNGGKFKNYNPGVTEVDKVNAYTGKIELGTGCSTTEEKEGNDTWYIVSK